MHKIGIEREYYSGVFTGAEPFNYSIEPAYWELRHLLTSKHDLKLNYPFFLENNKKMTYDFQFQERSWRIYIDFIIILKSCWDWSTSFFLNM